MTSGEVVTIHLAPNLAYLLKVYAAILDETLEGMILQELEETVGRLSDGEVLGQEVAAAYKELFPEKEAKAA